MKFTRLVTLVFAVTAVYATATYPDNARSIGTAGVVQSDDVQQREDAITAVAYSQADDGQKPEKRLIITSIITLLGLMNTAAASAFGGVSGTIVGGLFSIVTKVAWEIFRLVTEGTRVVWGAWKRPCWANTKCDEELRQDIETLLPDVCKDKWSYGEVPKVCTSLGAILGEIRALKNTLYTGEKD